MQICLINKTIGSNHAVTRFILMGLYDKMFGVWGFKFSKNTALALLMLLVRTTYVDGRNPPPPGMHRTL